MLQVWDVSRLRLGGITMLKDALVFGLILFTFVIPVIPVIAYHLTKGIAEEILGLVKQKK